MVVKKGSENGMLPTPQDSDAQEEKAERKRKRSDKSEEKKSKRKTESSKGKKATSLDSEDKVAKKAKKTAKGAKSGSTTADASGAEEELDPEKRALYSKRAEEKGVSLETYIKRRQEKYAAKKDEKRK